MVLEATQLVVVLLTRHLLQATLVFFRHLIQMMNVVTNTKNFKTLEKTTQTRACLGALNTLQFSTTQLIGIVQIAVNVMKKQVLAIQAYLDTNAVGAYLD